MLCSRTFEQNLLKKWSPLIYLIGLTEILNHELKFRVHQGLLGYYKKIPGLSVNMLSTVEDHRPMTILASQGKCVNTADPFSNSLAFKAFSLSSLLCPQPYFKESMSQLKHKTRHSLDLDISHFKTNRLGTHSQQSRYLPLIRCRKVPKTFIQRPSRK